jgi:hypothetical protein
VAHRSQPAGGPTGAGAGSIACFSRIGPDADTTIEKMLAMVERLLNLEAADPARLTKPAFD